MFASVLYGLQRNDRSCIFGVRRIICSVWRIVLFWCSAVDFSIIRFIIWDNIISMRLCVGPSPVASRGWDGLENQSLKEKLTKNWQIKRYGKLTNFCQVTLLFYFTTAYENLLFLQSPPFLSFHQHWVNLIQILTSVVFVVSKELKEKRFWATLVNRK